MFLKSIKDFFKNPIITLPTVILTLLSGLIGSRLFDENKLNKLALESNVNSYQQISTEMARFLSYALLLFILYLFINPIKTIATNLMVKNVVDGEKPDLKLSFKNFPTYYWRVLGVMVIELLLFIVLAVVIFIAMIPSFITISSSPENLPFSFILICIAAFLVAIVLAIALVPVEVLLVYDNLSFGEAFTKGFKFGFKNFFRILGAYILLGIIAVIINQVFKYLPGVLSIIPTLVSSYLGVFAVVYVMNLYKNTLKRLDFETNPPEGQKESPEKTHIEQNYNKEDDSNNFII